MVFLIWNNIFSVDFKVSLVAKKNFQVRGFHLRIPFMAAVQYIQTKFSFIHSSKRSQQQILLQQLAGREGDEAPRICTTRIISET